MTSIPPYFAAQMVEQKKWDDGFKAGVAEAAEALIQLSSSDDLEGPTQEWAKDFANKVTKKYL